MIYVKVKPGSWHKMVRACKKAVLQHSLADADGNVSHMAKALGISRQTTYYLLDQHKVSRTKARKNKA